MKVIATSDLHGDLPLNVPECDLFIVAGDSAPVQGSHAVDVQSLWFVEEFVPWLKDVPAKHKVFIGGNHDFFMDRKETFGRLLKLIDLPENIHYLRDSSVEIEGLKVHGFPWVPNLPEWAFHSRPEDVPRRVASIPEADIIVSHGPAEGILDKVLYAHFPHVGTPGLADRVSETNPALFVCGHIHEAYGLKEIGRTFYANVAQMNRWYEPVNPMVEFILDKRDGRWEVMELSQVQPSGDLTDDAGS
jgi:Icc-related predicted phosphoesterase